jgi:hypothetical protein
MNTIYMKHSDKTILDRAEDSLKRDEFMSEFLPTPNIEDWYEWRVDHWGTKWEVEASVIERTEFMIKSVYDSAWAPPIMFYNHLCRIGFSVRALYYEPGLNFCGIFDNGEDVYYDIMGMNCGEIKEMIPEELEKEFDILEYFSESESD